MADDDENRSTPKVGYKCPPDHSRFKPGQSGNPRGRPKGAKSLAVLVRQALGRTVKLTERGQTSQVTVHEALLRRLIELGLVKGELRAIEKLLTLGQHFAEPEAPADERLSSIDDAILAEFTKRLRSTDSNGDGK